MNWLNLLKKIIPFIALFCCNSLYSQTIVINEIAASNTIFFDEDGKSSDWFELYNKGEETISVQNWYVSDDIDKPKKWQFPAQSIPAKGFLLLFASDKDRKSASPFLHTNFKLKTGETLYLFDNTNNLQDSLSIPVINSNWTVGCFPDGVSGGKIFKISSPNEPNSSENYEGIITNEVFFSKTEGIHDAPIMLALSGAQELQTIRFTTDGSTPMNTSTEYVAPIPIHENKIIRAGLFRESFLPSLITTNTYLINTEHDLPIMSIVSDPENFFDENTGLYTYGTNYDSVRPYFGANFWKDNERPVYLSFFEQNGQVGFEANAGVKIFGGYSRVNDQRSLSFFFRSNYGTKSLEYPLFSQRPYTKYETFVLRNSGNDWPYSMIRDLTMTGLMENSNVDIQAGRSIVTYINGAYWGIYNLREKINEHYLASLHNIDKKDIDILEKSGLTVYGDSTAYSSLTTFVSNNNLGLEANFEKVESEIDLANFIQYQVAQIYFDNQDWPGSNIKFWRNKNGGKWRWILFDTDFGFGNWYNNAYEHNTLKFALQTDGPNWPNPAWATLFLRKLVEHENFRYRFINTFADELNTRFRPENVIKKIDENAENIHTEMPRHIHKWRDTDMDYWLWNVELLRNFAINRPEFIREHIQNEFSLPKQVPIELSIDNPSKGRIQLNSIRIKERDWTGIYFETVPITLEAIPEEGYVFDHWSGTFNGTESSITINPILNTQLTAHFRVETTTSIDKINTNHLIKISPNPFQNNLMIQSELLNNYKVQIDLLDLFGRRIQSNLLVESKQLDDQFQVILPSLSSGVYWLQIRTRDNLFLEKIIKN